MFQIPMSQFYLAHLCPIRLNVPIQKTKFDEIDAFLAMEVSSNFEEGYFDSEGDVIFLENLLSDDTTHNLAPEVISDHEPNESIHNTLITFSLRSDPLHHEFAGELLTLPSRIVHEHEDYLNQHKAYWALKHANFDLKTAGDHRKLLLNELNELRDQAYENSLIYKERTKKLHDSKIKNRISNVGDRVLLFNSRLKIFSLKLKTRWPGPFTITKVFPYGTIELSQPDGPNFKVNGHRVKHYFEGDLPPKEVHNLHTLPKDE
ncbi:hypothetical protein Tco_0121495 [Tanacetum coccineum]